MLEILLRLGRLKPRSSMLHELIMSFLGLYILSLRALRGNTFLKLSRWWKCRVVLLKFLPRIITYL